MDKLSNIEIRELKFKLEVVMYFLVSRNGYSFKLFNPPLPDSDEPDSDIIEYMKDIMNLVSRIIG